MVKHTHGVTRGKLLFFANFTMRTCDAFVLNMETGNIQRIWKSSGEEHSFLSKIEQFRKIFNLSSVMLCAIDSKDLRFWPFFRFRDHALSCAQPNLRGYKSLVATFWVVFLSYLYNREIIFLRHPQNILSQGWADYNFKTCCWNQFLWYCRCACQMRY